MQLGLYNKLSVLVPFSTEKRNTLVIGASQTGKTTLLKKLALDEIYNGSLVVYVDPTGEAIDEILKHIPKNRQKDVLLFDPANTPFAFNIFDKIPPEKHDLFASIVLETVKGVWGYENSPTPVLDQYLRATLHTSLTVKGTTFFSLKFLLTNDNYRQGLLSQIDDPVIKDFWDDFKQLTDKEQRQDIASTVNKLRAFMFSPLVRNCLDQKTNKLVFKDKIVLVSLRTRTLGTENASLLGALVLAMLFLENVEQNLYIDGSHFGTAILGQLLNNCPNVNTVLAVQFLDQVRREFQSTLLGGIGQIMAFRTSHHDAQVLEPDFNLTRDHFHLNELAEDKAYFCVDGRTTSITTILHNYPLTHQERKIIDRCISQCTAPLDDVKNRIARFTSA